MPEIELLYGRNALREALRSGRRRIHKVFIASGTKRSDVIDDIMSLAGRAGVPIQYVDRMEMEGMARGVNHHGIVAEAAPYPYTELDDLLQTIDARPPGSPNQPPLVLILDYVQDPQNLGTLIRTAEALAIDGIIIPQRRAASVTPAVVNASAGATEYLRIVVATNLARTIKELQGHGLWMVGLEQVEDAPLHVEVDLTGAIGLVIGSEGRGMSRLVRESCDFYMQLPMLGRVNSLNASVAGSIALYEAFRQRGRNGPGI